MSSINRPLAGPMMTFDLRSQLEELRGEDSYQRTGRAGRTLAKSGRFRLVLVAIAPDGSIGTHQAESPITVQVLEGHIQYRADGSDHQLHSGQILFFGPGEAHDIRAVEASALLLTISAIGDDFDDR